MAAQWRWDLVAIMAFCTSESWSHWVKGDSATRAIESRLTGLALVHFDYGSGGRQHSTELAQFGPDKPMAT